MVAMASPTRVPCNPSAGLQATPACEVREVLATLETVFQPLLPQINLRRWTGSIYDWLTQSALDPTNSGRVTMDNLMKLVLAALEWSYEAKAPDVQVEWLERAAELLVLRHDTFRIIDGEGPGVETEQASEAERDAASEIPAQQVSPPLGEQKPPSLPDSPGDTSTIPGQGGIAACRIGQLHVFRSRSHCPPAF